MSRRRTCALALAVGLFAAEGGAQEPTTGPRGDRTRPFWVASSIGQSATEFSGEAVLPEAAGRPGGMALGLATGVRFRSIGFGPRFSLSGYTSGMSVRSLTGELQWRLADEENYRFTFRLGAGYSWISNVNLQALGLGKYDAAGFTTSAGPQIAAVLGPGLVLGIGGRLHSVFFTRPAVGPCDDAHGCNGIFYPDERGRGGIGFLLVEAELGYDF